MPGVHKSLEVGFNLNIHYGTNTSQVSQTEINKYAVFYGLNHIARDHFSSLFVVNLMLLEG